MVKVHHLAPNNGQLANLQRLAPRDVEIVWVDSKQPIEKQAEQLKDAVAILVNPSAFPVELAAKCPRLRLVQVTSAGTNMIDKAALGELGVKVANNGGGNSVAVAEHTVALMVSTVRKLQLQFQAVKNRQWAGNVREWYKDAFEIEGKTVGIIGFGRIGSRVARRLQGWGCDILYNDVVPAPKEVEEELKVRRVDKDELIRTSDIITLHVPLDRSTEKLISDREFDMMKPSAVLINCCRGPVVDEAALIRAMKARKIAAAGLDVLEEEPTPKDNPLLDMDNVLVTPHLASFAQEAAEKSREFAMYNIVKVARGGEPESVVLPV
ncbi:MAG: 2-hydroxyacid dehydrogenase [Chloroflexi bacterium]|nr:2-hydroxyacid dehydrogenase [Chloroflexota bacterium]